MHGQIARFYYDVKYSTGKGGLKGSAIAFEKIVDKYPCFSFNDEVYYRLGRRIRRKKSRMKQRVIIRNSVQEFPDSEFNEKAREQLNIMARRFRRRERRTRVQSASSRALWVT